jgi:hypothetical protein
MLALPLFAAAMLAQSSPVPPNTDRAVALAGTWKCRGADQSTTLVFTRYNGGLLMHDDATPRTIASDFRYDPRSQTWTLDQGTASFGRFRGSAGPWTEQLWQFTGAVYPADPDSMFDQEEVGRVTFIAFGNDAFEMIRSQQVGGAWVSHDPWYNAVIDIDCYRLENST